MFDKRDIRYREQTENIKKRFEAGQVLGFEDFETEGLNRRRANNVLMKLKQSYRMDILTIYRGAKIVGWILADEVL